MWGDPEVVRYIGGIRRRPSSRGAGRCVTSATGQLFGFGMWTVRDQGGRFVGEVGITDLTRERSMPAARPRSRPAGCSRRGAHGRGLRDRGGRRRDRSGSSARRARAATSACIIDPPNAPSRRVAAKHGFLEERRAVYHRRRGHYQDDHSPGADADRASRATTSSSPFAISHTVSTMRSFTGVAMPCLLAARHDLAVEEVDRRRAAALDRREHRRSHPAVAQPDREQQRVLRGQARPSRATRGRHPTARSSRDRACRRPSRASRLRPARPRRTRSSTSSASRR